MKADIWKIKHLADRPGWVLVYYIEQGQIKTTRLSAEDAEAVRRGLKRLEEVPQAEAVWIDENPKAFLKGNCR